MATSSNEHGLDVYCSQHR